MKPYWTSSDGRLAIVHGDCRDVLPTLDGIDWIATDPPFYMPINATISTGHSKRIWPRGLGDTSIMATYFGDVFAACVKTMPPGGGFYTFADTVSHAVFVGILYPLFSRLQTIIWDKGRGGLGNGWRHSHELILHGAQRTTEYAPGFRRDVLPVPTVPTAQRDHQAEKPLDLLLEILRSIPDTATVLDPFAGSFRLATAAQLTGHRFVGIEIEERYCEIAARRLEDPPLLAAVRAEQANLFEPVATPAAQPQTPERAAG